MLEAVVSACVYAVLAYLGAGALFALAFAARGAARLDPNADGASLGFKLAILPGAAALWPWLLARWLRAREAR